MSRYTVYVILQAWTEAKNLPGNVRQRIRRAIGDFAYEPRPPKSICYRTLLPGRLIYPQMDTDFHRFLEYFLILSVTICVYLWTFEKCPVVKKSKKLDVPDFEPELRRLRLDRWCIVYAVSDVDVLAIRKRPPYDYGDLEALLEEER